MRLLIFKLNEVLKQLMHQDKKKISGKFKNNHYSKSFIIFSSIKYSTINVFFPH